MQRALYDGRSCNTRGTSVFKRKLLIGALVLATWCGQGAAPVYADVSLEVVSNQSTPDVVSLPASSNLIDLADPTSLAAEFADGTLNLTLCKEAGTKAVLIRIIEGQVKINGTDPASGPCEAAKITKIVVSSDSQENHIALDWGSSVNQLAVIAEPLSRDTIEIKGEVEVSGTLEIQAPVIQAPYLARGPTGTILLKENSELQNSENNTLSVLSSMPENIVLPVKTIETADKSSQLVAALPSEPKKSLQTTDNLPEKALQPVSARPQASKEFATLPAPEKGFKLPEAANITATVENRTLTVTSNENGPIVFKNVTANLKINGADPDTGPIALSSLDKIAVHTGAASHEITLDLNATTEKLTVEVAGSNDTLIVNGGLGVRELLKIEAPTIKIQGSLSAGHIELSSSQKTLVIEGAKLTAPGGEIIVRGTTGQVLLQPGSLLDVSANGITGSGRIEITAAQLGAVGKLLAHGGGTILLQGGKGNGISDFCFAGGVLDVSATALCQKGGTIHLLGQSIVVDETARLDASGDAGGGTILIGGEARGQGSVPNAAHTVVAQGAKITADALKNGVGGRVIIWSDKETPFEGLISARGGALGGDGGFVEVSGKEDLDFKGQVDVGAPKGKDGSVELDPLFVVVLPPGLSANITAIDDLDYLTFKSGAIGETTAVIGDFFCELFGIGGCNFKPDGDFLGNLDVRYGSLNTAIALLVKAVPKLKPLQFKAPFHFVQKGTLEAFTGNISVQSILGIVMLHSIDDSSGILEALYRAGGSLNFSKQTAGEKVKFETILTAVVMGNIDVNGADFEIYAGAPFDLDFIKDLIVGFLPGGTFLENAAGLENQNFLNDLNVSKILKTFVEGLLDPNQPTGAQQAVSFLNILCKDCMPEEISYAVDIFTNPAHNLDKFDDLLVALGADVPGWVSDMFDIIGEVTDYFADIMSPVGIINAALGGIEVFPDFHLFDIPGLCDLWDEIPCSLTDLVFDVIGPLIIEGIEKLVSAITGKDFDDISKFFESPIIIRDFSVENNSYPPLHVNDSINNPLGTITLRNDSFGSVSFGGPLTAREVTLNTPRGPIRNTRATNALRTAGPGTGEIKANKITLDAAGGIGQIHGFGPNSNQLGFLGALTSSFTGGSGFQFNDGGPIPMLKITSLNGGGVDIKATNKGKGGIFLRSDMALTLSSAGFILNKNETVSGAFEPNGSQSVEIDAASSLNLQSPVTNERAGGSIRAGSTLSINGDQNWAGAATLEARSGSGSGHDLTVNSNVFSTTLTLKAGDNVTVSVSKQANASTGAINVESGANTTVNGTLNGIGGTIQAGQNANLNSTSTFQTGTGAGTITAGDNLTASGNISANNQNLGLNAGENITFGAASTTNIGTGTLTILGDVGDTDTTGSTVTIDGVITATQLNATGGNQEDTFIVMPQVSTPIFVDGSNPTVRRGDVLDLQAPPGLLITQGLDKTISVQGRATIRHTNIESILNVPPTVIMGAGSNATINESGTYKSTASFIDWGADSWTVRIDFGDGTPIETVRLTGGADGNGPFPTINLSHVYGDNGTYTVTVEVTDNQDNGKGRATAIVTVNNLKPKVYLVTAPAILFHGGNAFLGRRGDSQTHTATGGDPGSDDLKFDWAYQFLPERQQTGITNFDSTVYYNDGSAPGTSFRDGLPSGPGNYPYFTAIESATVTFNEPGIYQVTVKLSDDDATRWQPDSGTDSQSLPKIITDNLGCTKNYGFWLRQFSGRPNQEIDNVRLQRYLDIINWVSTVFGEDVPASTLTEALAVLKPGGAEVGDNAASNHRGKAVQELFVAWLNFAAGGVGWSEVLRNGENFQHAMARVEEIILNSASNQKDYKDAQQIASYARKQDPGNSSCGSALMNLRLTPNSSSSPVKVARTFSSTHLHPNYWNEINTASILINSKLNSVAGLRAYYNVNTNKLYLMNDAGTAWLGGYAPGAPNVISNAQGSLNCATTTIEGLGDQLTVNWSFTPAAKWTGLTQQVYLYVNDRSGAFAGWNQMGTWTITNSTQTQTTTASSVTLSSVIAPKLGNKVQLSFTGALDPNTANNVLRYVVTVNGNSITVSSAVYANNVITLTLPAALKNGDTVGVSWSGLLDNLLRPLEKGQATVVAR